jgi:hypothetical protein
MTKNFNPKQPSHSNKDFPGCMGGLLNLFDFNQAHNGRRLLTEKRHGDGTTVMGHNAYGDTRHLLLAFKYVQYL